MVSFAINALQTARHRLILEEDGAFQFFDLEEDPLELRAASGEPKAAELRVSLERRLDFYRGNRAALGRPEISEQWLDELRAMGYVE